MTSTEWSLAVVVPARDEQRTIADTVTSIRVAADQVAASSDRLTSVTICVVVDTSTDHTAQEAIEALEGHQHSMVIDANLRSVGAARALGSASVISHAGGTPRRLWIANTDADTVVPPDWLDRHLRHVDDEIGCVAGLVDLPPGDHRLRRAFRREYGLGIGPRTHLHVHGANFGIRADVLLRLGNWPDLATGEDRLLWTRAGALGVTRRADPVLTVQTASRLTGRAPDGFAGDLARLANAGAHSSGSNVASPGSTRGLYVSEGLVMAATPSR